jgi:hypothetical protein
MNYIHKGKVLINGAVDSGSISSDVKYLSVQPEDDGCQIVDYVKGYFESMVFRGK